jgi:hypothetical protein
MKINSIFHRQDNGYHLDTDNIIQQLNPSGLVLFDICLQWFENVSINSREGFMHDIQYVQSLSWEGPHHTGLNSILNLSQKNALQGWILERGIVNFSTVGLVKR